MLRRTAMLRLCLRRFCLPHRSSSWLLSILLNCRLLISRHEGDHDILFQLERHSPDLGYLMCLIGRDGVIREKGGHKFINLSFGEVLTGTAMRAGAEREPGVI